MNSVSSNIPAHLRYSVLILGILASGFIFYIGQDIIIPLLFSILIAILMDPLITMFQKIKVPRIAAITLAILTGFLVISGLLYFIFYQLSMFNESLPVFKEKLSLVLDQSKTWVSDEFHVSRETINSQLGKWSKSISEESGRLIGVTVMTLTELIVIWLLIPVYVYLFLYYQTLFLTFIDRASDKKNQGAISEVLVEGKKMIQSYLAGLVLEMIIVAVLNSAGLMILGIEYAILLGIIGALLNVIPYLGGIVATALAMFVALITKDSISSPVLVLGVYILIQVIDNNFLIPLVVASRVKINALISIIVVLIFGTMSGIAGMFLAIPLTAIVKIIFDRIESLKPYGLLLGVEIPANSKFIKNLKNYRSKPAKKAVKAE